MPDGLEIDHANPLNGVMAGYAEHVVVCTGKDDWPSRIEDENGGDNLAADLKELFGRGGKYTDVSDQNYRAHGSQHRIGEEDGWCQNPRRLTRCVFAKNI